MVVFSTIDVLIVVVYLVAIVTFGLWYGRNERDATDYFLAGRALPWYLIGFSFFASNMSGASFVGLMGAAYQYGMVVYNYEWTATFILIFFAAFMLPVFLRARLFTVTGYLEARFDRRSRWAYSAFTLVTLLFLDTAGALYAGSIVINSAWPQVDLWQTSIGLAVVAGVYTIYGGLRAVVITDAMQAILVIVGTSLILWYGLDAVGGWEALVVHLEAEKIHLIKPVDDDFLPWPGIVGIALLGFYYWTLNQYFVQRALAASSLDEGRKGALFGGLLKLPNVFLMIIPGLIAVALLPELENPDQVFPALAFELLPIGLRGLIVTALLAAIMSSLDSALNAAASLLTMDFVKPLRPEISGRQLLFIGRLFTGLLIVLAALYAPFIAGFGSLFTYFQSTLAYLVPPIVAVYLGGLFWSRFNARGAFWAIIGGLSLGLSVFLLKEVSGVWALFGLPDMHFTYMSMIMFVIALIIMLFFTLMGWRTTSHSALTFHLADLLPEVNVRNLPWYRDYRVLAFALFTLMTTFIATWW